MVTYMKVISAVRAFFLKAFLLTFSIGSCKGTSLTRAHRSDDHGYTSIDLIKLTLTDVAAWR